MFENIITKNILFCFTLVWLLLISYELSASPTISTDTEFSTENCATNNKHYLNKIVSDQILFYNEEYKQIKFVQYPGGEDWLANITSLLNYLDTGSASMDYDHPEELRHTLLEMSLNKFAMMLQNVSASSSLFKIIKDASSSYNAVCALSLNPCIVANDDITATKHLASFSDSLFSKIPKESYLDHRKHLRFIINHEVYHCLDSYYNGPVPRSNKKHWAGYTQYRNELGADVYALLM